MIAFQSLLATVLSIAVAFAPLAMMLRPCDCWGAETPAATVAVETSACCSAKPSLTADGVSLSGHCDLAAHDLAEHLGAGHFGAGCCCVDAQPVTVPTVQAATNTLSPKWQPLASDFSANIVTVQQMHSCVWQPVVVSLAYSARPSVAVLYGVWLN